jgi:hypothetical protein
MLRARFDRGQGETDALRGRVDAVENRQAETDANVEELGWRRRAERIEVARRQREAADDARNADWQARNADWQRAMEDCAVEINDEIQEGRERQQRERQQRERQEERR